MSIWLFLWIATVFTLILWWDLIALTPGLLLLATGFVLIQLGANGWFKELLGIALVPVLGGVALSFGFVMIRFRTLAIHKPPLFTRIFTVLAIIASATFLPLERLLPFFPEPLHDLSVLRMLTLLALSGLAFLSLAELTVFKGFGFLLLVLTTNIVFRSAYGELDPFMLLANVMELFALLLLTRESLRLPMWLSWQQEEAQAREW